MSHFAKRKARTTQKSPWWTHPDLLPEPQAPEARYKLAQQACSELRSVTAGYETKVFITAV
ncbi:MAG TPA: hypothetical protein VGF19_03635, partial [Candidatus Acidoferrum sp.]